MSTRATPSVSTNREKANSAQQRATAIQKGISFGYVLLGIALARARAIPLWAAWLIVASAPLMGPITYGTGLGQLQILGFALVFNGGIPAALAMLKVRDEQALMALGEEPAPTT